MIDPRNCQRFQGLGGGPKIGPKGTPNYYGALGFGGVGLKINGFA